MKKINKAFHLKLLALLVCALFCLSNAAYGRGLFEKSNLRVPSLFNNPYNTERARDFLARLNNIFGLVNFKQGAGVVLYGPDGIEADNVNKHPLPKDAKILVIQREPNHYLPYQGNTVGALEDPRLHNTVKVITIGNDIQGLNRQLDDFKPHWVITASGDIEVEKTLEKYGSKSSIGLLTLYYTPINRETTELNCFYFYGEEGLKAKLRTQSSHKTQNRRTGYMKIAEFFSSYFAKLGEYLGYNPPEGTVGADPLIVSEFNMRGEIVTSDGKYEIVVEGDTEPEGCSIIKIRPGEHVYFVSPHPDDIELSVGGLVYYLLSRGVHVHNIIMNLDKWGVIPTRWEKVKLFLRYGFQWKEKSGELRRPEAELSAKRFVEGLPGAYRKHYHLDILNLRISEQDPGKAIEDINALEFDRDIKRVKDYLREESDDGRLKKGAIVIFPSKKDGHPHHRIAHYIFAKVLGEAYKKVVRPILFLAAWAGNEDTFLLSRNNAEPAEAMEGLRTLIDLARPAKLGSGELAGELTGGFGSKSPTPGQLGGGFAEKTRRVHYPPTGLMEALFWTPPLKIRQDL